MGYKEAGAAVMAYKACVWGVSAIHYFVKRRMQARKLEELVSLLLTRDRSQE